MHLRDLNIIHPRAVELTGYIIWINHARLSTSVKNYNDVIISAMAYRITGVSIVYSAVYSGTDQRKTSKLRVTCLFEGNSPVTGEFPAQRASNAENVSIWWRHHDITQKVSDPWTMVKVNPFLNILSTEIDYFMYGRSFIPWDQLMLICTNCGMIRNAMHTTVRQMHNWKSQELYWYTFSFELPIMIWTRQVVW